MTKGARLLNEIGEQIKTGGRFTKARPCNQNHSDFNFNESTILRVKEMPSSIQVGFLDHLPVEKARGESTMFLDVEEKMFE